MSAEVPPGFTLNACTTLSSRRGAFLTWQAVPRQTDIECSPLGTRLKAL